MLAGIFHIPSKGKVGGKERVGGGWMGGRGEEGRKVEGRWKGTGRQQSRLIKLLTVG